MNVHKEHWLKYSRVKHTKSFESKFSLKGFISLSELKDIQENIEQYIMKICPRDDSRRDQSLNGLVVSKLPVYTLHIFNWIPPMSLKEKKWFYVIYFILNTFIHILGITSISLNIYGIVSSKYIPIIPMAVRYILIVHSIYFLVNSGLFINV